MARLLVIDDDPIVAGALYDILRDMGHTVESYENPLEGEQAALTSDFDLVICDLKMPEKNGADVTKTILKEKPGTQIVLITAYAEDEIAENALKAGALELIRKPFKLSAILQYVDAVSA